MKKNIETNVNLEEVIEQLPTTLDEVVPFGLADWDSLPLPPKKDVANFYDGNHYRIILQNSATVYKMLTFTMEAGCSVYWENTSYGRWYFTDKTKASNFLLYTLTADGISEPTSVTWASSSSNYLNTTTQTYKRDVSYILFSNLPIHDRDKTTVIFEEMYIDDIYPYYVHLIGASFDKDFRLKPNQSWVDDLNVKFFTSTKATFKGYVFSGDFQETYAKAGSYLVTVQAEIYEDDLISREVEVLVNVYEDGLENYPNDVPFPPQDGMNELVVVKESKNGITLTTFSSTAKVCLKQNSLTQIAWFDGGSDEKNYSASTGSYYYFLNGTEWVFQEGNQTRPYPYPTSSRSVTNGVNDILFSTVNCYSTGKMSEEYLLRASDGKIKRDDYTIEKRIFDVPYDLPSVDSLMEEDGSHHYFISYRAGHVVLTTIALEDDSLMGDFYLDVKGTYSSSLKVTPSMKVMSVKYRRFDTSTNDWGTATIKTGVTSFDSSYSDISVASTLNKAITVNDMVIYTTCPIRLIASNSTDDFKIIRYPDNRLIADENSIAPVVNDIIITPSTEGNYTVDTNFVFNYSYTLEDIEGIIVSKVEWDNRLNNYPAGTNTISVRIQDNRGLWSAWFSKEFWVERPVVPAEVPIEHFPLRADGSPFEHYMIYKSNTQSGYTYFAFSLKEGEELPSFSVRSANPTNSYELYCPKPISILSEYAIYSSYENGVWGTVGSVYSSTSLGGYFIVDKPVIKGIERSAIYYSTFPILDREGGTHVYPSPKPSFPLGLGVACSHENSWTSDDVTVTVKINANGQAWHNFHYRLNGGEPVELKTDGELTFTESGDHHLQFFIYNQDNVETTSEVFFKIDKENPVLSIEEDGSYLVFKATDSLSGINQIQYRLADNTWTTIQSGFKLKKPIYGGTYPYELMAVDNVGNSHMVVYEYDLPKIPIKTVEVSPTNFELAHNQTQQLTVEILPANHNEQYETVFESLCSYVSVSSTGLVRNINGYYTGEALIKVTVNDKEVIVPFQCNAGKLAYPSDYPSLYDLHNIEGDYTDFIIYHYGGLTHHLVALKRDEVDSIFYLENSTPSSLCYTTTNAILKATRFVKQDETSWKRSGVELTVGEHEISHSIVSRYPSKSIVFSTIDLYANETGDLLAYPKDIIPPSSKARVWIETNGEENTTVGSINWIVRGEETGDGLTRLTYSINGGEEIEIENGGAITLEDNGDYNIQAFAYNHHNVRSKSETYSVTILASYPSDVKVRVNNQFETLQLSLEPSLVRYKKDDIWYNLKAIPSSAVEEAERKVQVLINGEWYTILTY